MSQYQMSIKEAKQEVIHTLRIYLSRNEWGQYEIPTEKQRPVLLMGPPGIGKTAIMEQVAAAEGVALVSYTITHHTRQSAIGLPVIREREYNGKSFSVTEYTMSEIISSIYDKMEQTGLKEGILFLDEINCVSETLAPTMLQFLQYKTFGTHRVPEGWIIIAAGNPPEYNRSVRPFDITTLDRLKRIDITEDYLAWREYAYAHHVHAGILSYLDIKKNHFYQAETSIDGEEFVTARGWEDLSRCLLAYEKQKLPVSTATIHQYVQHEEIARDFANYYELFCRYRQHYNIPAILSGAALDQSCPEGKDAAVLLSHLGEAPFDEAVSVLGLLLGQLSERFYNLFQTDAALSLVHKALQRLRGWLTTSQKSPEWLLQEEYERMEQTRRTEKTAGQLTEDRDRQVLLALSQLSHIRSQLLEDPELTPDRFFDRAKGIFADTVEQYSHSADAARQALTNCFLFLEKVFAGRQEMVLFVTELTLNPHAAWFISEHGCDKFYEYNRELLIDDKITELKKKIHKLSL